MAIVKATLSDDELEQVSGGVIFNSSRLITQDGKNLQNPWEVLDENGNILVRDGKEQRYATQQEAAAAAARWGVDTREESWDWVRGRRGML